jgi:Ca2+-binding RTX toxin-like protein
MRSRVILVCSALVASLLVGPPALAVGETCDGRPATKVGTPGPDVLTGTDGDDVIVGLDGDDIIHGLLGNDTLCGDAGSDLLIGKDGNDRLFGGVDGAAPGGGDMIWPGSGDDYVDAGLDPATTQGGVPLDTVSYVDLPLLAGAGVRVDLTPVAGLGFAAKPTGTDRIVVTGYLAVVGTPAADVLIGSPYLDVLVGRGGADAIDGSAGHDSLYAGVSADSSVVLPTGDGADLVDGGPGNDYIEASVSGGTTTGGRGDDTIYLWDASAPINVSGGDGRDSIRATGVDDVDIDAGPGRDDVWFSLFQDSGSVDVSGGAGVDDALIKLERNAFRRGSSITLDQSRGIVRTDVQIAEVRRFEDLRISGLDLRWTYRGTNATDSVRVVGARSLDARTRGGKDYVVGTSGPDVLDLGQGRDFANGRGGRDVCRGAERTESCEVR